MKQSDVGTFLKSNQSQWLNPQLLQKIAESPKLQAFFSNNEYMAAMAKLSSNPKEVMEKYGKDPKFLEGVTMMSEVMGSHFEGIAKEKEPEKEKAPPIKKPSVIKTLRIMAKNDKDALEILKDPKVRKLVKAMSKGYLFDLGILIKQDPPTAMKLQILMQKGFLNAVRNMM